MFAVACISRLEVAIIRKGAREIQPNSTFNPSGRGYAILREISVGDP